MRDNIVLEVAEVSLEVVPHRNRLQMTTSIPHTRHLTPHLILLARSIPYAVSVGDYRLVAEGVSREREQTPHLVVHRPHRHQPAGPQRPAGQGGAQAKHHVTSPGSSTQNKRPGN